MEEKLTITTLVGGLLGFAIMAAFWVIGIWCVMWFFKSIWLAC